MRHAAARRRSKRLTRKNVKSHPVFGEKQVDGGVSNDVHAEFEGLNLSEFPWLGNLRHFHGLIVSRNKELPQTIPYRQKKLYIHVIIFKSGIQNFKV